MTDHISKADAAWAVRRVLENVDPEMCDLVVDAINALPASPVDGEVMESFAKLLALVRFELQGTGNAERPPWRQAIERCESALNRKDEG